VTVVQKGETPTATSPTERRYQLAVLVLVVLVLVGAVFSLWLVSKKNSAEDDLRKAESDNATYAAGPEARDAAESMLLDMTSYSYKDIDDEYTWLDNFSSDELRQRYAKQIPKLKKIIKASHASAKGQVVVSAYNTVDEDSATVLAYVRQVLKTKDDQRGAVEDQWTTLKMVRDGSGWKIDDIDIVTVPPPS
jgi:Mce-associated membrane protein